MTESPIPDADVTVRLERVASRNGLMYGDLEAVTDAIDEVRRLRDAVWSAIPWLDELQHLGSIVDHDRRIATLAKLRASLGLADEE